MPNWVLHTVSQHHQVCNSIHSASSYSRSILVTSGTKGRICVSEIQDAEHTLANHSNPMQPFATGQSLEAVHLGYVEGFQGRKLGVLDLSIRPAVIAAAKKDGNIAALRKRANKLKPGHTVYG